MVSGDYIFSFSSFPEIKVVINYFIENYEKFQNSYSDISLYKFITYILKNNNDEFIYNQDDIKFLRYLDSITFYEYYPEEYINKLSVFYYNFVYNESDRTKSLENKSFREWCEKWQSIYGKNTRKQKSIRNVIMPFQKEFLERLWNPHSEIGKSFAVKHINKLDWNKNNDLEFICS